MKRIYICTIKVCSLNAVSEHRANVPLKQLGGGGGLSKLFMKLNRTNNKATVSFEINSKLVA